MSVSAPSSITLEELKLLFANAVSNRLNLDVGTLRNFDVLIKTYDSGRKLKSSQNTTQDSGIEAITSEPRY